MSGKEILSCRNISMSFGNNLVLDDVNICAHSGEVVSIIGHNGAGKSTLMNIVCGALQPVSGEILLNGLPVVMDSPKKAKEYGVCMVHQELCLFNHMSVWENIFIENLRKNALGLLDRKMMRNETRRRLQELNLDVDPDIPVASLSVAQKQMLEICREIGYGGSVLVLDEPSSAIGKEEVHILFALIELLKTKKNMSIIYISHRLDEVAQISDRIYALRGGKLVDSFEKKDISIERMVNIIMGGGTQKERATHFRSSQKKQNNPLILEIKNLKSDQLNDISLSLREGEVLGLGGFMGAGRSEILRSIYGVQPYIDGSIIANGKELPLKHTPIDSLKAGICLATEERKEDGLFLGRSISENIALPILQQLKKYKLIMDKNKINELVSKQITKLGVICNSHRQTVGRLSGGNQQKVVLAKWLAVNPKILLLDEPTRGIDIAAKEEIFRITRELAEKGMGIIFVSSDFAEMLRVCDRIIFLNNKKVVTEIEVNDELTEEMMMIYAAQQSVA